ncbi:NAALAD [Mytilus edulis]|uniref:NAALAD n=1 Tax=Mytilus edulis TaxID=6550 RepID=A0A8S3TWR8_MYTED|nr:NAALAD [Mytilus edulis]
MSGLLLMLPGEIKMLQGLTWKCQGELVYGDYGRSIDLVRKNRSMSLQGKVLMIRQGEVSIKEKVGNISVRLVSNYIQITQSVKNVVGSITGDLERDRFILIGASRSHRQLGTSYLLELARSFKDMQRGNGWTPWRSVKFCSWDHDGIPQIWVLVST